MLANLLLHYRSDVPRGNRVTYPCDENSNENFKSQPHFMRKTNDIQCNKIMPALKMAVKCICLIVIYLNGFVQRQKQNVSLLFCASFFLVC